MELAKEMVIAERQLGSTQTPLAEEDPYNKHYFKEIGRPDLDEKITPLTPMVDFTMEMYLQDYGVVGGGGLGIVKGDTALQVEKLKIPFMIFTPFYATRMRQVLDENFYQHDVPTEPISPNDLGHEWILDTSVRVNGDVVNLSLYKIPGLPIYEIYEPGIQYLYPGENSTDHRLYQEVLLGFGCYSAIKGMHLSPSTMQIDEAVAVFAELARFDDLCQDLGDVAKAKEVILSQTLFTNHTNAPAAIATFSSDQLERYVMPNIESNEIRSWLRTLIGANGGNLNLSVLALALSGKLNGVSRVHAQACSDGRFRYTNGEVAEFGYITNGVFLERWVPEFAKLYRNSWVINNRGEPTENYEEALRSLDPVAIRNMKNEAQIRFREYASGRIDQYGNPVIIPEGAKIACWTKRIADYKRPEMLFTDPQKLAEILEEGNVHVILAGRAHPQSEDMKRRLQDLLRKIDAHPVLKERVHFFQDYDEEFAQSLIPAIDICFNTPITMKQGKVVNTEADGTFWKKAIAGWAILVSTRDGGVADVADLPCFEVKGDNYETEVESLYACFKTAVYEVDDIKLWEGRNKRQLVTYMPIICAGRMVRDYVNYQNPKAA